MVEELVFVDDGNTPIRADKVGADQIITGSLGKVGISTALLGKHFLCATEEVHPATAFWLHLCSKQTSRWLIVDRDHKAKENDTRSQAAKYSEDSTIVNRILGKPNLVVTSRSGKGFHFYYLLDDYYDIEIIKAYAKKAFADNGIILKNGVWEVFPKDSKSAMTPLPFGINSYIIHDNEPIYLLGFNALIYWHNHLRLDHVLTIDTKNIALDVPVSNMVANGANTKREVIHSTIADAPELSLKGLKRDEAVALVQDLFANPSAYRRREAQKLLKFHYLDELQLGINDSIARAWQWLCTNINSKDISKDSAGAKQDLVEFFSKPTSKDVQYSYRNHISYYEAHELLKRLVAVHDKIKAFDQTTGKRNSYFLLSVYSVYFFLYNQSITRNLKQGYFTAKATEMRTWFACSEQRYKQAVAILIKLDLLKQVKTESIWDSDANDGAGGFRNECYKYKMPAIPMPSVPNDNDKTATFRLNEASFVEFLMQRLPKDIGADLFGVKGYARRQKEMLKMVC